MNRSQLIEQFNAVFRQFQFEPTDAYVAAGGAMVLHGLRETTLDIDVTIIDYADFNTVEVVLDFQGAKIDEDHASGKLVLAYQDLEIHFDPEARDEVVVIDGVPCQSLESILKLKRALGRDKDIGDIQKLKERLGIK